MGGQMIISLINTVFTLILVIVLNLPHKVTLVCLVFICGLFPVVGNLVSNTILVVTALVSRGIFPSMVCLIFLVAIHKLEYFLNSRIIGTIVKLPMAVTLVSILVGEALLGVGGIIIAIPFILFLKREFQRLKMVDL